MKGMKYTRFENLKMRLKQSMEGEIIRRKHHLKGVYAHSSAIDLLPFDYTQIFSEYQTYLSSQ